MSTHNICVYGEIRKILSGYPLLYGAKARTDELQLQVHQCH